MQRLEISGAVRPLYGSTRDTPHYTASLLMQTPSGGYLKHSYKLLEEERSLSEEGKRSDKRKYTVAASRILVKICDFAF
jgi:hypothetical protein